MTFVSNNGESENHVDERLLTLVETNDLLGSSVLISAITAESIMDRNCLIIPQQLPVREAARLLLRKRSHVAAVVDKEGRCTGILRAADVFRWIEASCPYEVVDAGLSCRNEVRGRLLNGIEAVICTRAHGSCPFQMEQPTTGGRHTEVCQRQEAAGLPWATTPRYMTTTFVSIRPQSPLSEMVRHLVDSRVDELIVLDEFDRPAGIVSATDIVITVADGLRELATAGNGPTTARKPK